MSKDYGITAFFKEVLILTVTDGFSIVTIGLVTTAFILHQAGNSNLAVGLLSVAASIGLGTALTREVLLRSDAVLLKSYTILAKTQDAYIEFLKKKMSLYEERINALEGKDNEQ